MIWDLRNRLLWASIGLALIWGGCYGVLTCGVSRGTRKVEAQVQKANEAKGRADEHAKVGADEAAQAKLANPADLAAKAEIQRLKAELAAQKRRIPARPAPAPAPVVPELPVGPVADGVPAQDELKDQIIAAQDARIVILEGKALRWEKAYHEANAAFRAERDRTLSLELALEAQKSVSRASLWRGRFQGLAVGFGAGYITGRVR